MNREIVGGFWPWHRLLLKAVFVFLSWKNKITPKGLGKLGYMLHASRYSLRWNYLSSLTYCFIISAHFKDCKRKPRKHCSIWRAQVHIFTDGMSLFASWVYEAITRHIRDLLNRRCQRLKKDRHFWQLKICKIILVKGHTALYLPISTCRSFWSV